MERFLLDQIHATLSNDQRLEGLSSKLRDLVASEQNALQAKQKLLSKLADTSEQRVATQPSDLRKEQLGPSQSEDTGEIESQDLARLEEERTALTRVNAQVDSLEESFDAFQEHRITSLAFRQAEMLQRLERAIIMNEKKLAVLTSTDLLNEAFLISSEKLFGTINGLRLGTTPAEPVDWHEINTAWGFAALLLDSMAKEVEFGFFIWYVEPRGSQSVMVNVQNTSQTLSLHCNTNWFWNSSFNAGISAFAGCVDELGEFARREDPSVILPYKVCRSTIAGLSLHYSQSVEWTKAMKFILTNMKWLLIWLAKRRHKSEDDG